MRSSLSVLALVLVCAACVPIPVPIGTFTRSPFEDETLRTLQGAARRDVRKVLGAPHASKVDGRYWFYADSRESLGFIGADAVFEDYEWVAVGFDENDRAVLVELNEDMEGCLSNGICHRGGLFGPRSSNAVITAPTSEDIAAKAFRASEDSCAVYVYHAALPLVHRVPGVAVTIDGRRIGSLDHSSFLLVTHPAGTFEVTAYQLRHAASCSAGERLYLLIEKGMSGTWKTGKQISAVDEETGEKAIRKRALALAD